MSTTANRGAGALSRFAHFAGIVSKPKAADPATDEDVSDVQDDVEEVKDEVEEVKDDLEDLEQRVEDVEEEQDDEAPEAPAERAAYQKGRKAERARAGAILSAPVAAKNRNLALHLAFETSVPAKQAIATLNASAMGVAAAKPAKSQRASLDARMGAAQPVSVGVSGGASGPDMSTPEGVAAFILSAGKSSAVKK
jgi:hypothetical protein